jgi:predicted metal-dependent TIM-barrel fold hydrolase
MDDYSADEAAERAGVAPEYLERLIDLRLLRSNASGRTRRVALGVLSRCRPEGAVLKVRP